MGEKSYPHAESGKGDRVPGIWMRASSSNGPTALVVHPARGGSGAKQLLK
ncbi:MAG: hypothetical protein WKF84_08320 [Pyrinomonadaceae bacterium]